MNRLKIIGIALLSGAVAFPARAQNLNITGTITAGGMSITGSATNDSACAGCVGQFVSSRTDALANQTAANNADGSVVTSAPLLTTAVPNNVTQILLGAGDWDCRGDAALQDVSGAVTIFSLWTSIQNQNAVPPQQVVNTNGAGLNHSYVSLQAASVTSPNWALATGSARYSLAAATSVYLNTVATFASGTVGAQGVLDCRRMR
jgi:hypothetical protein